MTEDIKYVTDRELLERIYSAQLRMQMDIDLIWNNVKRLHQTVDPDAFDPTTDGYDNPTFWKDYLKLHSDFSSAHASFNKELERKISEENKGKIPAC